VVERVVQMLILTVKQIVQKTETLEVVEPEDPYAYMIPDSTGLFGMLPVHIFSAVWEKDKNA
jgi:hypothetical protein